MTDIGFDAEVREYRKKHKVIMDILKDIYDDCDIDYRDFCELADNLYDYVYDSNTNLGEILGMVYEFEEYMREEEGVKIDVGRQCVVYDDILDILEVNEPNAHRLYKDFLFYNNIRSFVVLMDKFGKWLTDEEKYDILEIAKTSFLPFVWDKYL